MQVDAGDQIAMAAKSTSIRDQVPAWRFVLLAAFPKSGTRSPFPVPRSDPLKLEMPACSLF
jgi:hypothetical protein